MTLKEHSLFIRPATMFAVFTLHSARHFLFLLFWNNCFKTSAAAWRLL